jgi:hypothetical protein
MKDFKQFLYDKGVSLILKDPVANMTIDEIIDYISKFKEELPCLNREVKCQSCTFMLKQLDEVIEGLKK